MIDIGANLTNRAFAGDLDAVLGRAEAAGVSGIVVTGTSVRGSEAAADLAGTRSGYLWATAGVHPHDAKSCDEETLGLLRGLHARAEVVAVGECGLDYNRDFSPRPVQDRWFEAQIGLAVELSRPLFLHERDAHERFLEIFEPWRDRIPAAVVHCFTGTADEADAYLDLDLHLGVTGWICDERRGVHLRDVVKRIPGDRLMIETDAPYLLPRDLRPRPKTRRNEPQWLPHIAATVAECRGEPVADVVARSLETTRAFFGLNP
ncbi:MAG: hydrolase TatD [Planctomycetes bacterium]|nr:hydrolase TatD [Planctomycetota bacterium]